MHEGNEGILRNYIIPVEINNERVWVSMTVPNEPSAIPLGGAGRIVLENLRNLWLLETVISDMSRTKSTKAGNIRIAVDQILGWLGEGSITEAMESSFAYMEGQAGADHVTLGQTARYGIGDSGISIEIHEHIW